LLIFSIAFSILLFFIKRSELPGNAEWAAAETRRTGQLADAIGNVSVVKAFAHEDLEHKLMMEQINNTRNHSLSVMRRVLRNEYYSVPIHRLINLSAILISFYLVTKGVVGVGIIYLTLTYTLVILRRLWDLSNSFRTINRVFGDAYDMTDILEIGPEVEDPAKPETSRISEGQISFKNVAFAYKEDSTDDMTLFEGLDLEIYPGEKVGLVGPSGGGKTTITKLLLRFMDIQSGDIKIDGQDIAALKQQELRKHISYVSQEPLMFHRSLADNIRYGRLDANDKEVQKAAKMAHAEEFIDSLPNGYATLVGERGTKLSGGQRQRVAIARAMLKDAPILVLDEATSALDSESEVLIQDALWKLMEGRTAIVIAHRLSTIQKMDRIIVLDKGEIVEQGTHKELIEAKGAYASLWAHQSGGFLED
jgi:ATP-binding cassette subfamily B protein